MDIQGLFPSTSRFRGWIHGIVDSYLSALLVEKVQKIAPTCLEDLTTKMLSLRRRLCPEIVVRNLSWPKRFSTVVSEMEDSDFDAQPTNQFEFPSRDRTILDIGLARRKDEFCLERGAQLPMLVQLLVRKTCDDGYFAGMEEPGQR